MKARKQISDVRRHSRTTFSRENIWFFTQENSDNEAIPAQRKLSRNERSSALVNYDNGYSIEEPKQDKSDKECSFIVDWQMSSSF
jgi:hypothetical protein